MPFLAPVIAWLFTSLVDFFSKFFTLRRAFLLSFSTILLALLVGLITAMKSCISGVCGTAISGMSSSHHNFAVGLGMVFNGTTATAISCYLTVWIACQLYIIKKRWVQLTLGEGS